MGLNSMQVISGVGVGGTGAGGMGKWGKRGCKPWPSLCFPSPTLLCPFLQ